jgi:hypothetical protein
MAKEATSNTTCFWLCSALFHRGGTRWDAVGCGNFFIHLVGHGDKTGSPGDKTESLGDKPSDSVGHGDKTESLGDKTGSPGDKTKVNFRDFAGSVSRIYELNAYVRSRPYHRKKQ